MEKYAYVLDPNNNSDCVLFGWFRWPLMRVENSDTLYRSSVQLECA